MTVTKGKLFINAQKLLGYKCQDNTKNLLTDI